MNRKVISSIYKTIKYYRAEDSGAVHVSPRRIEYWIKQFDKKDQAPILIELDNILKKRYLSKRKVKGFLRGVINTLTSDFGYKSPVSFLRNVHFLDMQEEGKSQKMFLRLMDDLLTKSFGFSIKQCGKKSKKYSLYVDDFLCTGKTFYENTKTWCIQKYDESKSNYEAISDNSTTLIFVYIYTHQYNYLKQKSRLSYEFPNIANKHKLYRYEEIENGRSSHSKMNHAIPQKNRFKNIEAYRISLENEVNTYRTAMGYKNEINRFYRPKTLPVTETFFTSLRNRRVFESALLRKGIEILSKTNYPNKSMRPLGYSVYSHKDFGFGALCFTWRNVPNNTPLVFWYSGGGFTPLFKKREYL